MYFILKKRPLRVAWCMNELSGLRIFSGIADLLRDIEIQRSELESNIEKREDLL